MRIEFAASGKDSGYGEALSVNPNINQTKPDRKIWLADGSSPVPNYRSAELFLTVWASYEFGTKVPLDIDITSSGISFENHSPDEVEKLGPWFDFYSLRLMTDRRVEFIPFGPAGLLMPNELVRKNRMVRMQEIAEHLKSDIGEIALSHVNIEDGSTYFNVSLLETQGLLPQRTSLGKFVCPTCSYQRKEVVTHAVRYIQKQLAVTHGDSTGHVKCPAALVFLRKVQEENPKISDLIRVIGFSPSGKLFYLFTRNGEVNSRGLCMRDYSNPRGTVADTVKQWDPYIWISTRFYMLDPNRDDLPFDQFIRWVEKVPHLFARLMRERSVLSSGQAISLIVPSGCP